MRYLLAFLVSLTLLATTPHLIAAKDAPKKATPPAIQHADGNRCDKVLPPDEFSKAATEYLGDGARVIKLDEKQVANITKVYNATPPVSNEVFGDVLLFLSRNGQKAVIILFNVDGTPCHAGPIDPVKFLNDMNGGDPA